MNNQHTFPSRQEAENLLLWAREKNPGLWFEHSKVTARVAEVIALKCSLDANAAYILGLLHDIGRYDGVIGLRHVLSGYKLMNEKGYHNIAGICLTHSFPYKNIDSYQGALDCNKTEIEYIQTCLENTRYNDFDRLIQLSDCLSLAEGVCLLEVRLIDVAKRSGINQYVQHKWNAYFELKTYFDNMANMNIYDLFGDEIKTISFR
jgi:hypothetical protein